MNGKKHAGKGERRELQTNSNSNHDSIQQWKCESDCVWLQLVLMRTFISTRHWDTCCHGDTVGHVCSMSAWFILLEPWTLKSDTFYSCWDILVWLAPQCGKKNDVPCNLRQLMNCIWKANKIYQTDLQTKAHCVEQDNAIHLKLYLPSCITHKS